MSAAAPADRARGASRFGPPLAILVIAATWAVLTWDLSWSGPEGPGPAFVPRLLCGLLALLALLLLAVEVVGGRLGGAPGGAAAGSGWGQAVLVIVPLALYIAALAYVGFVPATLAYAALAVWQCGGRSVRVVAGTAVGITAAVWVVLVVLFKVPLR